MEGDSGSILLVYVLTTNIPMTLGGALVMNSGCEFTQAKCDIDTEDEEDMSPVAISDASTKPRHDTPHPMIFKNAKEAIRHSPMAIPRHKKQPETKPLAPVFSAGEADTE